MAGLDLSCFCVLQALCQKAQARKRSSSAPPWRMELSWAKAPLMLGTITARCLEPSAAGPVWVQDAHEVPQVPTLPFDHSCWLIHSRVSKPSSASGAKKSTSP